MMSSNAEKLVCQRRFFDIVSDSEGKTLKFDVQRGDEQLAFEVCPVVPLNSKDKAAKIGIGFGNGGEASEKLIYPSPLKQVGDSLRMMWVTIAKVASPKSSVGAEHLAGPVGIGKAMFDLLTTENGWRRLIWFLVLFNVNLAVLNMMPFPVLDGGHVTLATLEAIARRPVKARFLEVLQMGFAIALICLMLYVTSKDIGDEFGRGEGPAEIKFGN